MRKRMANEVGKQIELGQFALLRVADFELVEMVGHNVGIPIVRWASLSWAAAHHNTARGSQAHQASQRLRRL
jgi:hypothetical protein